MDTDNAASIYELAMNNLLSIYLYLFVQKAQNHKECGRHIQRTGQWNHSSTEHCPKYI